MSERVLLIGASKNKERYANKAQKMLISYGHDVVPVNPREEEILGVSVVPSIAAAEGAFDTVTLYVRPEILKPQLDALINLRPKRVIFNPGTEDSEIALRLQKEGIEPVEACTLVLLRSSQF